MKKVIAVVNPILMYSKYLLLTAILLLSTLLFAQFLLKNMNIDASISGNAAQTIIPFIITAAVSMVLMSKFRSGSGSN